MKRQSAAEAALAKQVRNLDTRLTLLHADMDKMQAEIDATAYIQLQLNNEIARLKQARETASIQVKPNE